MFGPAKCRPADKETAGTIMVFLLTCGLTAGGLFFFKKKLKIFKYIQMLFFFIIDFAFVLVWCGKLIDAVK